MSFSQSLRNQLNRPIHKRSFIFISLTPILFILSVLVMAVAAAKRRTGYRKLFPKQPPTFCFGNISMGGSGKTPLLKNLLKDLLEEKTEIAILSRGYGAQASATVNKFQTHLVQKLSDENREYYYSTLDSSGALQIFQNPHRILSLKEIFLKPALPSAVFLDDGLQHFSCPRHKNIVLLEPELFLHAPLWPFPLGPFREGNPLSMKKIVSQMHVRIWSRCKKENVKEFKIKIEKASKRIGINPKNDFICTYETCIRKVDFPKFSFSEAPLASHLTEGAFVCGIGNPQAALLDLREHTPSQLNINPIILSDHGFLSKEAVRQLKNAQICFFTHKDLYRLFLLPEMQQLFASKEIYVLEIECKIVDWNETHVKSSAFIQSMDKN